MSMQWHFAVLSKDTWWHPRRARKQLLYQALTKRDEVISILHANASRLWWRPRLDGVDMPVPEKMEIFTPTLLCPGERFELVRRFNRYFMATQLRQRWQCRGDQKVLFFYNPRDVDAALSFRGEAKVIYDWTEDWAEFYQDSSLIELQKRAVREADAVVAVTEELTDRAIRLRGDNKVLWLPNATALPIFLDKEEHPELKDIPVPRMGYLGHLGPWFDAAFIRDVALHCSDWSFVFVGSLNPSSQESLSGIENVHCLGVHQLDELPAFLAGFDVCIAPYIGQGFSGDASKFYDYLTSGKPIVTTQIPGIERFGDSLYVADDVSSWRDAISQAMGEVPSLRTKRLEMAKLHTWDHRAIELLAWLSGLEE